MNWKKKYGGVALIIAAAQENGLKIAFLSHQEKDELRQKYQ
ncbi:hypothetical protein [Acinetobacter baumannii]|nr:hypothetical protein [Acinetobacter baumannii]